jgi:hypothetical protein
LHLSLFHVEVNLPMHLVEQQTSSFANVAVLARGYWCVSADRIPTSKPSFQQNLEAGT